MLRLSSYLHRLGDYWYDRGALYATNRVAVLRIGPGSDAIIEQAPERENDARSRDIDRWIETSPQTAPSIWFGDLWGDLLTARAEGAAYGIGETLIDPRLALRYLDLFVALGADRVRVSVARCESANAGRFSAFVPECWLHALVAECHHPSLVNPRIWR